MEWASYFISETYRYLNDHDDTGIDRLNRLYTVALLSAFVTLICSQQYIVGKRILCWAPQDFTAAHIVYAHDICWLGQTNYYIPENLTTLDSPSTPRAYPFLIYPWLPLILVAMTVSFAAPYLLIWHGLSGRSGIDIKRLLNIKEQKELLPAIHYVFFKRFSVKRPGGNYVVCIYMLTKVFYILNVCIQIMLVNKLLFGDSWSIDPSRSLKILSVKYNMWSSAHFPIETMCDFMVRMLGQNNNWFTLQCILPFNLFTKRIFALLTIWFLILLILNLIDFILIWLYQQLWLSSRRYEYILTFFHLYEKHFHNENPNPRIILAMDEEKYCKEFVYEYLGRDGYFVLKLLHARLSDMDMVNLVVNLFEPFVEEKNAELQSKRLIKHSDHTAV